MEPPAAVYKRKKQYGNMRTRLRNLLKREKKSEAGRPERTIRDNEIMRTLSFLKQHIARGEIMSNLQFDTT